MQRRVIVWFRNDLRLHDNEALKDAIEAGHEVLPVYIFDPRVFNGKTEYGFAKTGANRARFVLESVENLRHNLQQLGSNLLVRSGKPEEVIFEIAREIKSTWVFCNRERTQEEVEVQDALEHNLWSVGQEIRYSRGKMLYFTADLPFPVTHTPDTFTQFRKEVERFVPVRDPLPAPTKPFERLTFDIDYGDMPSLSDWGHEEINHNHETFNWKGGEAEGLKQLNYYLWDTDLIAHYKETRDQLVGRDFSSKLSAWLSLGCLSPKQVYHEVKRYEKERMSNKSTYWLIFELLWRDFFRLMGKKHGNEIFHLTGTRGDHIPEKGEDKERIKAWTEGKTGTPFVDANMRELNETGFMSNRGRQNVASYFIKDLEQDWRIGAQYFESMLLDYDPCSNYGNWNYIAGVGSDPRENRYFNILTQAKRHDPKGVHAKLWLQELSEVDGECIHDLDFDTKTVGYPDPIVKNCHWD